MQEDLPKKRQQKPRKRRKLKQEVKIASDEQTSELLPVVPPKKFPSKHGRKEDSAESSTSWKPESSTPPVASSGKSSEEPTSDGSNTELLPPIEDLLDKKKAESAAAEAETQMQLSRVRQRIADLLDDAFAMAGGRKITGSMRNKRVDPATNVFPQFGNLRSKSAAEADYLEKYENDSIETRPQSEGGQRIFGALTEEGQLITRPLPKLVWEEGELPPMSVDRPLGEITEAHNHQCIHFFSFHHPHQRSQLVSPPQARDATSPRELIPEVPAPFYLNQSDPELHLALSPGIHPAAIDQYDEIDVVGSLRDGGENVAVLLRAIKEELQRFGSLPGESHA
ncbi:uncharacterized protein LOC129222689 [Uloborus diversus]|uniref:uncharacterized protein LOC129222689 n=1 Tax=Uloborus diversus TaxID=327109 RepID=UPI00240963C3|nr:uncharacterized protein LOC129222689 [Uloborus diversus]